MHSPAENTELTRKPFLEGNQKQINFSLSFESVELPGLVLCTCVVKSPGGLPQISRFEAPQCRQLHTQASRTADPALHL